MRRFVVLPLAAALLAGGMVTGGTAASGKVSAAAKGKFVSHNCSDSRKRPPVIDLACHGGNGQLERLNWNRWGGDRAKARGKYIHFKKCFPRCGFAGPFPVRVTLTNARPCGGRLHYRLAKFRFTDGKPRSLDRRERQRLACPIPGPF